MANKRNGDLVDLFALTGWSKGELARLVNRRAAGLGYPQLATDTSRVRRWLEDGERPRDPVPRVLAALFTERLGRVVTHRDLGFAEDLRRETVARRPDRAPWTAERSLDALTEFTGMDLMLGRRGATASGLSLLSGPALVADCASWLTAPAVGDLVTAQGAGQVPSQRAGSPVRVPVSASGYRTVEARPVGPRETAALEEAVVVFRAWDADRGGGLQRKAVVGQLNEVGHLLADASPDAGVARLWSVAADLAALAGWMSHDSGLEPTAQNYFVIAAHAAREAGDVPRAAEALSRAARQLVHLGRPGEALDLVVFARHATAAATGTTGTAAAMLYSVEAWAHAALGDGERCAAALTASREAFAVRDAAQDPSWIAYFDEGELHGMHALALRTLAEAAPAAAPEAAREARDHARRALALRDELRRRSRTFDTITLASACLLDGRPDLGAHHGAAAVRLAREVSSRRAWQRLRAMGALADRYQGAADVAELRALLDKFTP